MRKLLCYFGIHFYKYTVVDTKLEKVDCKGIEQLDFDKEFHWHEGRTCTECGKEQYYFSYFSVDGYKDVIK